MTAVLPTSEVGDLGPVGRRFPIVPREGNGGWTLVGVVAILAFLAALAAGTAALVASSSAQWRSALTEEATIQVRPVAGRDEDADVEKAAALARATPGIRSAEPLARADAERLLEPWLGAGLDLSELPVPRLVVIKLDPAARAELPRLALRLKIDVPGASLDDHSAWLARLSKVTTGIVLSAIVAVLLVLLASAGAIAFATRGVVAGHRDVVEVLHFVGAGPGFVAGLFARRFSRLGFLGGLIGSLAAVVLLVMAVRLSVGGADAPGSRNMLVGTLAIGPSTYLAVALVALADGIVAGVVAAATVKRFLKKAA
jgi:cell division transport system permease protein